MWSRKNETPCLGQTKQNRFALSASQAGFGLLAMLLVCVAGVAHGAPKCQAAFTPSEGIEIPTEGSEGFFLKLVSIPDSFRDPRKRLFFKRYWTNNEVIEQAVEMTTAPAGKEYLLHVSDQLRMKYTIIRTSDRLTISIPVVRVAGVELGGRTKGMNLDFAKFMTGVLRTVEQEKRLNPHLRHVRINADKIMNADLITLLEELGFSRVQRSTLVDLVLEFELI